MCVHISGIPPNQCAVCRRELERAPLPTDPIRSMPDGTPVLVLRAGNDTVTALTAEGLRELHEGDLQSEAASWRVASFQAALSEAAAALGFLFTPRYPLTQREQLEDIGAPHCYSCRTVLSYDRHSLGCRQCNYYVCSCGRCLCGVTARNWQGVIFSQLPPLEVTREDRLEFVRAFRFLNAA